MKKEYLAKIVRAAAENQGIDPRYFAAIVWQESGGYPFANRYEPGFYAKYIDGKSRELLGGYWSRKISETTERKDRTTSFGLIQIMGQVARENGVKCESLTELVKPMFNLEIGAKHFRKLLNRNEGSYRHALIRWNGSHSYA